MIILKRDLNNQKNACMSADIVCFIMFTEFKIIERIIKITLKVLLKENKGKSQKKFVSTIKLLLKTRGERIC